MKGACFIRWACDIGERLRREDGNVAILVALSIVVLCGFGALVVDAGVLYVEKQRAQAGADAGALAGADDLLQGANQAASTAYQMTAQNTTLLNIEATADTVGNSVTVTGAKESGLWLARVLGFDQAAIRVSSRAQIGTLVSATGIVPIAVPNQTFNYGTDYTLSQNPGNGQSGNYGFLDFSGNGANGVEQDIEHGYDFPLTVGELVATKPGVMSGPVSNAIQYRLSEACDGSCEDWQTAQSDCPRVVYLPVVDTLDVSGKKDVTILGFAAFYLEGMQDKQIIGKFIRMIRPGQTGTGQDFGTYSVKLTN